MAEERGVVKGREVRTFDRSITSVIAGMNTTDSSSSISLLKNTEHSKPDA